MISHKDMLNGFMLQLVFIIILSLLMIPHDSDAFSKKPKKIILDDSGIVVEAKNLEKFIFILKVLYSCCPGSQYF